MTFNDIITTRYSVRTYSDRPVEEEKIPTPWGVGFFCLTKSVFFSILLIRTIGGKDDGRFYR